ncbi:hypothetical protein ACFOWA_14515 [Pedobacter lithocola]|uniref:SMI1/KNR4 family protein n=1 Tax=Pedobacter lithocola TaxID=1908239 RepID=A0ABV8PAV5_9SPHI
MSKIEYLKKYNSKVEIIAFETLNENQLKNLPEYWKNALSQDSTSKTIDSILTQWKKFPYQFQSTIGYLQANLLEIELLADGDQLALLYTIKNVKGNEAYYIGYNPNTKPLIDYFEKLPESFKDIYNQLHNGWVYYASKSNGLLPIEDTIVLADEDWGILEEIDVDELPFNLQNCIGLFDNGKGDYASIDLESENKKFGFIWWHTKAPKLGIEIWPVIDEWTKIGMER